MKKNQLKNLEKLLIINKEAFRQFEKNEESLNFNIKYWTKKDILIRIKKGEYLLRSRLEKEDDKQAYLEYIANKLYEPSYLSCEYVMDKYGLLTEGVFALTSATTKKTKTFNNKLGRFVYYSLSSTLFLGYTIKKTSLANIFIASKTKAVFDYLYLRFFKKTPINEKNIEELRINWENLNKKEFLEIKKYGKISKSKRIGEVINLIFKKYYA
jgi:predicted transcriptional regulator of viral defense system